MRKKTKQIPMRQDWTSRILPTLVFSILLSIYVFYQPFNKTQFYNNNKGVRVNSINFDTLKFTLQLMDAIDLDFPEVHMLICFKETSACRGIEDSGNGIPSLCSEDWKDILGFNIHNYSGVKHPKYRKTTSLGSIGNVYENMLEQGFELKPEHKYLHYYLLDNVHAVYASAYQHALDLKYRQMYFYEAYNLNPISSQDYIEFLRISKYNPYKHYFDDSRKGLHKLYADWRKGRFQNTYNRYFHERMQVSLKW